MNTLKTLALLGFLLVSTSCGLIDGELFRKVATADLGSSPPPVTFVPTVTDSWGVAGKASDLVVSGSYLIAGTNRGLVIYDITDPYSLAQVNSVKSSSAVVSVTKVSNYLFVSYADGTLELVDITSPSGPALLDSVALTAPRRVVTQGSMAYVPDGNSGVRVLDFSDPSNIQIVTTVDTPGFARNLALDGVYLYLADDSDGFKIFDITVPTTPTLVGSLSTAVTSDDPMAVAVKGNYAYVAVDWYGVDIIDISNKAAPAFVSNYYDSDGYYEQYNTLEIRGNNLIAAHYENGFNVFDISTPTAITYVNSAKPFTNYWFGDALAYATSATHAFVATEGFGIATVDVSTLTDPYIPYTYNTKLSWFNSVDTTATNAFVCENNFGYISALDITDLSHPTLLGKTAMGACRNEIVEDGGYVYSANGNSGMLVFDFSNPAAPVQVGAIDSGSSANSVFKVGNYVYMTYSTGLYIYNVTTPSAPTLAGSFAGGFNDVYVEGNYAYLAGSSSLRILDISNPAAPASVATYNFPTGTLTTYEITKSGNNVYLAGQNLWAIVDVSTVAAPALVRRDPVTRTPSDIAVIGSKVYICEYYTGVQEWDISDINNIKREKIYRTQCLGIKVRGTDLFSAGEEAGLKVLNATSKPYIDMVNKTSRQNYGGGISISDNKSIVSDSYFGLLMYDITDPKNPEYLSRIDIGPNYPNYEIRGTNLYTTDIYGIFTFDVSDPAAPVASSVVSRFGTTDIYAMATSATHMYTAESGGAGVLGVYSLATPSKPTSVTSVAAASMQSLTVAGSLLFGASGTVGLRIFDLANPAAPVQVGLYNTPDNAKHAIADGIYAYIADGTSGLQIINISNPAAPTSVGVYNTPGNARWVAKKDNFVFVADSTSGVQVVDVSVPATPVLKTTLPLTNVGGYATNVTIEGNYLHVSATELGYEIFDISDMDNIHQ